MHQFLMQGDPVIILLTVILSAIAVESLIVLIKDSDLSKWLLHPIVISRYNNNQSWYNLILYKWVTCGHCMSFVYSFPFAGVIAASLTGPFSFLLIWLVLQRLSNWFNDAYKLLANGRVNAIEFISPLMEVHHMSSGSYMDQIREREFRRGSLEVVRVRTLSDIQRIIKSTSSLSVTPTSSITIIDGKSFSVDTSTNHPPFMHIIRDMLQEEQNIQKPTEEAEPVTVNGEKIIPLQVQTSTSVEKLIEQCTGGVRDGNRIKWELDDGSVYFYNPISEKLTKLDNE